MKKILSICLVLFSSQLLQASIFNVTVYNGCSNWLSGTTLYCQTGNPPSGGWTPLAFTPVIVSPYGSANATVSLGITNCSIQVHFYVAYNSCITSNSGCTPVKSTAIFPVNLPSVCAGGTYTQILQPDCSDCYTNVSFTVRNNTTGNQLYKVFEGGADITTFVQAPSNVGDFTSPTAGYCFALPPGQSMSLYFSVACGDVAAGTVHLDQVVFSGTKFDDNTGAFMYQYENMPEPVPGRGTEIASFLPVDTNPVGVPASSGNLVGTQQSPVQYLATNSLFTTNPPIVFSDVSNINTTTAEGDSAVFTAIENFALQNHMDLQNLLGRTNGLYNGSGAGTGTVFVENWPTNFGTGTNISTNILSLTNYNLESTQEGISNLIWGISSNLFGTNVIPTNSELYEILSLTNRAAALSGIGLVSGFPAGEGADEIGSMPTYDVSIGGIVFHFGTGLSVFQTGHSIVAWALFLGLFLYCWKVLYNSVLELLKIPQATTAGTQVLGTNANFAGALTMATLIVAVAITLTAVALPQLAIMVTKVTGDPFSSVEGTFGYSLLAATIPVGLLVSVIFVAIIFRVTVNSMAMVGAGIVKFFVGL